MRFPVFFDPRSIRLFVALCALVAVVAAPSPGHARADAHRSTLVTIQRGESGQHHPCPPVDRDSRSDVDIDGHTDDRDDPDSADDWALAQQAGAHAATASAWPLRHPRTIERPPSFPTCDRETPPPRR